MIKLRIHHFFDLIKCIGNGCDFDPKKYGHNLQKIAKKVCHEFDNLTIRIVMMSDDVCPGCKFLKNGYCLDKIGHRKDFLTKEDYNSFIDSRILEVLGLDVGLILSVAELFGLVDKYLDNHQYIYAGDDFHKIENEKIWVTKGTQIIKILK